MTNDERISKELRKLKRIFKNIPKDKTSVVEGLMKNAAFMAITLEDLQDDINERGISESYENTAGKIATKKTPEADIYNSMIKNYLAVIKQLVDLLPKDETTKAEDELVNFIQKAVR